MMARLFPLLTALLVLALPVQPQDLQETVNISFVADDRLFAVMAAINAGGFDYETAASMHPVRRQVRQKLKSLDVDLLRRLRDFYVAHHAADTPQREVARYTSLALLLSGPPRYEMTVAPKDIPPEVREVSGFEQILPGFYQRAGLEQLWLEVRPEYLAEVEKYKPVMRQAIAQSLEYLKTEARVALDRQILFIPDLMSPHGISNSRIVNNLYYLIVGPAEGPEQNLRSVRHEYLHFLLDPLIQKNALEINRQQEVLQLLSGRPELLEKFRRDPVLLHTESLIEAVQLRIDRPGDASEQLMQQYGAGNVLVYHYHERLQDYEKGAISFPEYLSSMIQALSLKGELERRDWFTAETERRRQKREQEERQSRERSEWLAALEQANLLLQKRNFVEAERFLLELKARDPNDPPVLFGLGQIEMQKQNAAPAEAYFKAVVDHPKAAAWMAAWSRLYLATVYLMTDRVSEARGLLEQVSQSPGELKGAREEARRRLAAMPAL